MSTDNLDRIVGIDQLETWCHEAIPEAKACGTEPRVTVNAHELLALTKAARERDAVVEAVRKLATHLEMPVYGNGDFFAGVDSAREDVLSDLRDILAATRDGGAE